MANAAEFNAGNFTSEVIESGTPVLVDFWAPWCGPCRAITPIVEKLAVEYAGKVKIGKCNVDDNQDLAFKYNVESIPALLLFKSGQVVQQLIGIQPESRLRQALDQVQG
jgi:thioredoxin 1